MTRYCKCLRHLPAGSAWRHKMADRRCFAANFCLFRLIMDSKSLPTTDLVYQTFNKYLVYKNSDLGRSTLCVDWVMRGWSQCCDPECWKHTENAIGWHLNCQRLLKYLNHYGLCWNYTTVPSGLWFSLKTTAGCKIMVKKDIQKRPKFVFGCAKTLTMTLVSKLKFDGLLWSYFSKYTLIILWII